MGTFISEIEISTCVESGDDLICQIFRHSRAKRLKLTLRADGSLRLTLPNGVTQKQGRQFLLQQIGWIRKKTAALEERQRLLPPDLITSDHQHYRRYKNRAGQLIEGRLKDWNRHYQLTYRKLSIRNSRTVWGSCSSRGNLSFSYKILFLPQHLQDYIIVHELCHLKELNHSRRFWQLVARTIPDYQARRQQLKEYQPV